MGMLCTVSGLAGRFKCHTAARATADQAGGDAGLSLGEETGAANTGLGVPKPLIRTATKEGRDKQKCEGREQILEGYRVAGEGPR